MSTGVGCKWVMHGDNHPGGLEQISHVIINPKGIFRNSTQQMAGDSMARRHWAEVRKILEQDLLCTSLKGRVRYFSTRYRKAHDGVGRVCVLVDGKEVINMPFSIQNERYGETHNHKKDEPDTSLREIHEKVYEDFAEKGLYYPGDFGLALDEFLSADIQAALSSNNDLVRMLAILDRRAGKRALEKIKRTVFNWPEWLQYFYNLRIEGERESKKAPCVPKDDLDIKF